MQGAFGKQTNYAQHTQALFPNYRMKGMEKNTFEEQKSATASHEIML